MQAVRQEAVNKPFYRSTQCRSCSHKVVLLVFGSNLTLTFFSGSREIFLFMFCPEQGVNLKRLQDTGLYSILTYINTTHLFLKEKSEKPLEFCFFVFFRLPCRNIILTVFCSFWQPKRDVLAGAMS